MVRDNGGKPMIPMLCYTKIKPVKGCEGLYEIGNNGLLHSIKRKYSGDKLSFGSKSSRNGRYRSFSLRCNGITIQKYAHRLVYETFIGDIPQGYDVHHKNGNPKDNRVENLELIELHKHRIEHKREKFKPVVQYTKDGEFVAEYPSVREAERQTGIHSSKISAVCMGKKKKCISKGKTYYYVIKKAGGYIWKYK